MANALKTLFNDIAVAIRNKNGDPETVKYKPMEFPEKISRIENSGVDPYYQSLSEALMLRDASYISDDPTVMKMSSYTASDGDTLASLNTYAFAGFTEVEAMRFINVWYVSADAFAGDSALKILDITAPSSIGGITFEPGALTGCDALEAVIIRCASDLRTVSFRTDSTTGQGHGSSSEFYVYVPEFDYDTVVKNIRSDYCVPASRFRKLEDYPLINQWDQKFTINFYDGDSLIKTQTLKAGEMPSCSNPTKDGYVFTGWSPTVSAASENMNYYAKWSEKADFATSDWDKIARVCEAGGAAYSFTVGQTRKIQFKKANGTTFDVEFAIIGINQDTKEDGTKAGLTLTSVPALSYSSMGIAYSDFTISKSTAWENSTLRSKMNSATLNQFPTDLQQHIKAVKKVACAPGDPMTVGTGVYDKVWMPSITEYNLGYSYSASGQGTPYNWLYNNRQAYSLSDGTLGTSYQSHSTRSTTTRGSSMTAHISTTGAADYGGPERGRVCFCI